MIETDILIIGAGPTGLFTVFEAGLLKLKCHLIDALPQPGGQCSEIYPKKPIYDIPAYPEILAGDLTEKLLEQIASFQPGFTLGERAETIEKLEDDTFILTTQYGQSIAEERIWFVSENVRCRSSVLRTSAGSGILQTSFASEIRRLDSFSQ